MKINVNYLTGGGCEFAEIVVETLRGTESLGILDLNGRISLASNLLSAVSDLVVDSFESEEEYMEFVKSYV